jgi:peptidoglycan/LPS O-acetylase OafA/YrhL
VPARRIESPPEHRTSRLGYLPGLDGLRAVSVLAVMAFHHYFIGGHEEGFAPGGFLGVEVFFVVSGYLITSLLLAERRETGGVSLPRFWLRRARRLLPALFAMVGVVILYAILFLPDSIDRLRPDTLGALTYTSNWWLIVSHQSYIAEAGRPALLKHLWSLAIEEQFYLFWPPLLLLGLRSIGRRRLLRVMMLVALASTVLMAIVAQGSINQAYYSTSTRLSGLLLGSAMAFFYAPYQIRGRPGRGVRWVLDVVGLGGLLLLYWCFGHFSFPNVKGDDLDVFRGGFLVVDLATLLVIAAVVHPRSDMGPILGIRPLRWIGLRSYSLYLWHYPIFCVTRPGLDVPLHGWPLTAVRLLLTFGAAELSYRFVEVPIRSGAIGRYLSHLRTAQGPPKRRIARRGLVIGLASVLVVFALGAGLANAQGETPHIPGIDEAAQKGEKGDSASAETLRNIRNHTSTTTTTTRPDRGTVPTGPTGPTGGSGPTGPTGPTRTTTTTPITTPANPLEQATLAIGDSVMLGARESLHDEIPGIYVDAVVSRQFWDATAVIQAYKDAGLLPGTIVIHLGTNGAFRDDQFEQIMAAIGPDHRVFFVNAHEPRPWESEVNSRLWIDVQRYPDNARLIDWHRWSDKHPEWFVQDGVHLTGPGAHEYASLIRQEIERRR